MDDYSKFYRKLILILIVTAPITIPISILYLAFTNQTLGHEENMV